jgi:hypothetical protein
MRQTVVIALVGAVVALPSGVRAPTIFTDVGPPAADILDVVNACRAALGEPNNANHPAPFPPAGVRSTGMVAARPSSTERPL